MTIFVVSKIQNIIYIIYTSWKWEPRPRSSKMELSSFSLSFANKYIAECKFYKQYYNYSLPVNKQKYIFNLLSAWFNNRSLKNNRKQHLTYGTKISCLTEFVLNATKTTCDKNCIHISDIRQSFCSRKFIR